MAESTLKGKRILVIEDDVKNLAVFATTLHRAGASVIQDHWNAGATGFATQNLPIDLIVLDLMLRKGISGYDIVDQLKANPRTAHIPVVIVSSLDAESEIPKAKAKGCAGFISKPISVLDFPDQLVEVLDGKQIWIFSR